MIYLEYEECKQKYIEIKGAYEWAITEKEKAFRQGYIAACEWFLEQKPTRTQVKEKENGKDY